MRLRTFVAAGFALGLGIGVGSVASAQGSYRLWGQGQGQTMSPTKFVIKQGDITVGRVELPRSVKVFLGNSEVRLVGFDGLTVEFAK